MNQGKPGITLLLQPNPVSGTGNINFSVNEPGEVSLILYDMNARPRLLHSGFAESGESHTVSLNAGGYVLGVYMVELVSGSTRARSKLLILE